MLRSIVTLVTITCAIGCSHTKPLSCTVTCVMSSDCPEGQTCSDLGRCTGTGTCDCVAGSFLGCSGDFTTAVNCNASGNGTTDAACGAAGCNASAGRCNQCAPSETLCTTDGKTLQTCDTAGLPQPTETCALSCVDGTTSIPAHCEHVAPAYVPNACDAPATAPNLTITGGTIDPGLDATCTAIATQAGGPDVCVIRAGTITIMNAVTISGPSGSEPNRAIALVADHDLTVSGTIDLSARGIDPGPGGGATFSGAPGSGTAGGGGAGSFTRGGNGANDTNGNGGAGGATISPPIAVLMGGPSATSCIGAGCGAAVQHTFGGGGGGGLLLTSCLGTVTVSGIVNAAGGGGQGARLNLTMSAIMPPSGGGGGGNIAIAGVGVTVTGSLFANGGGGGGGCNNQAGGACPGGSGGDGQPSTAAAATGGAAGTGATGGGGGVGSTAPGIGIASGSIPPGPGGGGGGAAGHLQIYVPIGVAPTVTQAQTSPPLDPPLTAATR
jgi:hypothetical protein